MRLITILFPCFAFIGKVLSQDSLVLLNDVKYSSDFEKKAFDEYFRKKDKSVFLKLFLAVSPVVNEAASTSVEERISSLTTSIKASGLEKKKPEKKIKSVYDQVHNPLLKKYEIENRFYEIFQSGNYNCVSATALYALMFDRLEIPYEIKEEPTHVYLLGYPNKENILVETTSPLHGYLTFNDDYKLNYVTTLKKQKVIGSDEADRSTVDALFNKYYFKNEKITVENLVGIQYMNDAIFRKDHNELLKAYQQMEKAYLFYPSSRCEFLLFILGTEVLSKEKLDPKDKCALIAKLSRFKSQGITNDMIKGEFANLTQDVLFRDNNKKLHYECYQILKNQIKDKELNDEITYVYNYENGRAFYNQGNFSKSKPYFEKALAVQPNNVDLGSVFVNVLAKTIRPNSNNKNALDTLNSYRSKYPSLDQNNNFKILVASATLIQFGDEYDKGKPEAGEKYKTQFESFLKDDPTLDISPVAIGKAYAAACSYYFTRGQKAKAKEYLLQGLKISPDNYELRVRMQMIR